MNGTVTTSKDLSSNLVVTAPTFQQNCTSKYVPCIDNCDFLCIEKNAKCIGGYCEPTDDLATVACETNYGGILMMSTEPVPHWSCICTHASFFGGKDCSVLNEDVCEHGMFLYNNQNSHTCLCLPPYKLVIIEDKPHCIEKSISKFFPASPDKH